MCCLLLIFAAGCTKELNTDVQNTLQNVQHLARQSSISQHDIEGWLQERIDDTLRPHTREIAAKVLLNADFGNMIIDSLNGDENLIFIPLEPDYFSQHVDENSEPLQYFILFEDAKGNLYKENIVLYYPEDPGFTEITFEGYRDFINSTNTFLDQTGKMELITISDMQIADYEFENGILARSSYLASEYDPVLTEENGFVQRCTRWWLVRVFYDLVTREIIDYLILAEGNTCENDCPPHSVECDEGFGGGVFGDEFEDVEKEKKDLIIWTQPWTYTVRADVKIFGKVSSTNRTLNYFTNPPQITSSLSGCVTYDNPYYGNTDNLDHVIAKSMNLVHMFTQDNKQLNCAISVLMQKTNIPNVTFLYHQSFRWLASTDL